MINIARLSRQTGALHLNGFPYALAGQLAFWAVAVVLAWVGVSLFWRLTISKVSAPLVSIETHPLRLAEKVKELKWFGVSSNSDIQVAPKFVLRGLIGASGRRSAGVAIFLLDSKIQKVVGEGEEISQGYILVKVRPDGVQIQRNGGSEFLPIPKRTG